MDQIAVVVASLELLVSVLLQTLLAFAASVAGIAVA